MNGQTIYDISLPISEKSVVWPGDPPIAITQPKHISRGDSSTVSQLSMGAHTGTHLDAPAHFILDGKGVDSLDLNILVGKAFVVEALNAETLTADVLESLNIPDGTERILFHTSNSDLWETSYPTFNTQFAGISEDGAKWLVSKGIKLVGIDYLSVAPYKKSKPTHTVLLSSGIIILEGLDLRGIESGTYQLVCLPLKIVGIDGSPARAILID